MKTFVIIKPDAITRGLIGRIILRFEDCDFNIVKMEMKEKGSKWFAKMYSHLRGDVYRDMRIFMTHTPLIGIVLEGPYAVEKVRRMIGHTNSIFASPGTIRGDFGSHPIHYNCIHASDNAKAVKKEIALFFGE